MSTAPHIAKNGSTLLLDKDWVRSSFMLSHVPSSPTQGRISDEDKKWLYFTTASQKFTTTGLGGNFVLNPAPKYTRFADVPTGVWVDSPVTEEGVKTNSPARDRMRVGGMGRYYSESIDDNSYNIHLRFGVPEYKGLVTFFTGFYDIDASRLAREGRISFANLVGRLIGTVVALPLLPVILAFKAAKFFLSTPSTKYYTSKPTMPLYWNRVNMIATNIAMTKGLIPKGKLPFTSGKDTAKSMYEEVGMETTDMTKEQYRNQYEQLRKVAPDWFNGSETWGGIDIQAIVGKPQIVANRTRARLRKIVESSNSPEEIQEKYESFINKFGHDRRAKAMPIDKYLQSYFDSRLGHPEMGKADPYGQQMKERVQNSDEVMAGFQADEGGYDVSGGAGGGLVDESGAGGSETRYDELAQAYANEDGVLYPVLTKTTDADGNETLGRTDPHTDDPTIMEYVDAVSQESVQWLVLKVDAVETVSESFSNSTTQSEIQSKINDMSSTNQAARFSLSDFNTGFKGIDAVINTVKSTMSGIASGLQLDGLVSLTGAGFVDIPERWDDSASEFPSSSYTIQLRAPYGDLLSQFINIDVPLACLLAAALPISHGNQSYGSPFLCEMYAQGKNVIRLGMISSLSITRGTGNMGWSPEGSPLGIDVSFTIKDLSTIMHAPIDVAMANPLNPFAGLLPRDSAFHDYLAVLGNMSLHSMTTTTDRFRMSVANKVAMYRNMVTPAHVAGALFDTGPGRVIQRFRAEAGRTNDGLPR